MHSKGTWDSKFSSQKQSSGSSESSSRKTSTQQAKRYRKSSSSSNESIDRDKQRKTTLNISKNGSSETEKSVEFSETTKSSKTIENAKHSVEKSQHSGLNRQNQKKSGGHSDEDSRSSSRRSRHGGHSHEHSRDDKHEDKDDKTNKGKSKSKHKSKNEKQPQIQDIQTKSESEISENVQVTTQSPEANIDIPVDNDTECGEIESTVPCHVTSDTIPRSISKTNTKECLTSDSNDSKEHQRYASDIEETCNNENEIVIIKVGSDKIVDTMDWQPAEQEIVLDVLPNQGDSEILDYQEEVLQGENNVTEGSSNGTTDGLGQAELRSKSSSPDAGTSSQITDDQNAPSNNAGGVSLHSDEDSGSIDAITLHESSNTPPRGNKFNLSESFASDVKYIENINSEIQNIKVIVGEMFATPPKPERKHKWGNSLAGLALIKPIKDITIETIKEFCPNVVFLEENEIKLAAEHREKKVDRRISMETKSDEETFRRYDTQSSHEDINSETDNSNIIALNRKISIVEDTASKLRPPPSPARNPVSSILYISNLVRPFTLKQLMELLERTGRIRDNGFWTDRIKSKCYVHYENADYAMATRNALHGVNWPIGNGKQLMIEYATPEELEKARNPAPVPAAAPEKPPKIEKENIDIEKQVPIKKSRQEETERVPKEKERHKSETYSREWHAHKEETRNKRSRSRRPSRSREIRRPPSRDRHDRRHSRRTITPPDYRSKKLKMKEEEPQKLMDDLFHKTKSVPSVYWLPLTPEEIATKQQERLLRMAEHKRRIEESSRNRGDHGRGAPYRRRYD